MTRSQIIREEENVKDDIRACDFILKNPFIFVQETERIEITKQKKSLLKKWMGLLHMLIHAEYHKHSSLN